MSNRELATAADYADAMLTARRAKQVLVLVLLLMLLGQLGLFFATRYSENLLPHLASTTQQMKVQIDNAGMPSLPTNPRAQQAIEYATSGCLFLGIVFSLLLSFVLLLVVNIMLVGRLIGVARVVSSYLWCLLLMLLLFPWQAFLSDVRLTTDQAPFKIPGIFYTWAELSSPAAGAHFATDDPWAASLKWTRYVVAPLVAILILLVVQIKSNRGIRQALGEDSLLITDDSIHA